MLHKGTGKHVILQENLVTGTLDVMVQEGVTNVKYGFIEKVAEGNFAATSMPKPRKSPVSHASIDSALDFVIKAYDTSVPVAMTLFEKESVESEEKVVRKSAKKSRKVTMNYIPPAHVDYESWEDAPACKGTANQARLVRSVMPDTDDAREHFGFIAFSARMNPIAHSIVFSGGVDFVHIDSRILFSTFLAIRGASSILVFHNHPSASPVPSDDDVAVTNGIAFACGQLGIRMVDHIIMAPKSHYSFRENGLLQ